MLAEWHNEVGWLIWSLRQAAYLCPSVAGGTILIKVSDRRNS